MPLFQQSVLKKYINDLDKAELNNAWQLFTTHFLDAVKQANIRNLKEEEYQEGFIRDLFVNVLGCTLNPQPGYNFAVLSGAPRLSGRKPEREYSGASQRNIIHVCHGKRS